MERPLPIQPEELLSHARWMRALARSLVSDAASADDVVQESLTAVLRRPPQAGRPLQGWLAGVVRNVASNLRRGERRRAERHARRGAEAASVDPAETIERLDTQRLIVDLVRELDEPARSTIVLGYFEGLTSVEIGRRMGVSDATVRWRTQKALDELRARLERRFGSRDAWCAMLLPLAHSHKIATAAAASGAATGALTMGAVSKIAIAAVSLSIVGAGLWYTLDREQPGVSTAEAAAPHVAVTEKPFEPVAEAPAERAALPAAPAAEPAAKAALPAAVSAAEPGPPASARVRARFVDVQGHPWSQVRFRLADQDDRAGARDVATASDADGRAELPVEIRDARRDPNFQFVATHPGCATRTMRATLTAASVVDLGEVVLDREARVKGFVHDAAGAGLADVTVGLSPVEYGEENAGRLRRHGSRLFERLLAVQSDAGGNFDLRGVPAGAWRAWGHFEGRGYGVSAPFEVKPGDELAGVDFEVPALLDTDWLHGTVVDPQGAPVAEAEVMLNYESENESGTTSTRSRADGSFDFLVYLEAPVDLIASDKEDRYAEAVLRGVPLGSHAIVLQLADASKLPSARIRVHGPEKEPVREAKLESRAGTRNSYSNHSVPAREVEPGLYEFQVPPAAFGLDVTAPGYLDGETLDLRAANLESELVVALERAPVLRGRVRAAGAPVPGALIEANREVTYTLSFNGFPCTMDPNAQATTRCDDQGAFTLVLKGTAPVFLRCSSPGYAPTIVGPLRTDGSAGPVAVELQPGGSIEGRARAKDGTPVVGAIVGITCGDGHPRTMRSGLDGLFRFDGLSEGSWLVLERDEEFRTDTTTTRSNNTDRRIDWSCEVVSGRTTFHDLTLDR